MGPILLNEEDLKFFSDTLRSGSELHYGEQLSLLDSYIAMKARCESAEAGTTLAKALFDIKKTEQDLADQTMITKALLEQCKKMEAIIKSAGAV